MTDTTSQNNDPSAPPGFPEAPQIEGINATLVPFETFNKILGVLIDEVPDVLLVCVITGGHNKGMAVSVRAHDSVDEDKAMELLKLAVSDDAAWEASGSIPEEAFELPTSEEMEILRKAAESPTVYKEREKRESEQA